MIEVRYKGRMGNNLFQYCFGRILAQELGFALKTEPIPGFPETFKQVTGEDNSGYPEQIISDSGLNLPAILKDRSKRKIILDGYFQKYEYYLPYRDTIRNNWLRMGKYGFKVPNKSDLVMHIRRDDIVYHHDYLIPYSFFEDILKQVPHNRLFICTDDPKDPFITHFREHNATVYHAGLLEDFSFLKGANQLAISLSSYS